MPIIKMVMRYDRCWPKLRLFRLLWEAAPSDGMYNRKLAVALRPRLFAVEREWDGWRVALMGVDVHFQRSYCGGFV